MKIGKSHLKITNLLLIASVAVLLFGTGYKLGEYKLSLGQNTQISSNSKNIDFSMFWKVWDTMEKKYVDQKKIDPKKMYYGAIKGLVASVEDPYTFFLTPVENKQSKDGLEGKFEGIGASLGMKGSRVVVMSALKDSPAEKAHIQTGDFIVKVNNEAIVGMPLTQVVSKVRGDKGTTVHLTLERDGKEVVIDVVRDTIHVKSVEVKLDEKLSTCTDNCDHVAYLTLNQFGDSTIDEWAQGVADIKAKWESGEIKGLVLDLRDNPGGYLESSVYLAGEFLDQGKLVVKQESTSYENKDYFVTRQGSLLSIPMTVLINGGSASAAEILAGALRDYKRAALVGEKSFGKGSVQEAIDLGDGMGLHVTVAKWVLPKGDWINGKGIEPETKVVNVIPAGDTLSRSLDKQLDTAIERILK
ncbi:MAG: S41 family peptidase [Candidatus Roizmanbacteria bacterium]|nr:S41 family peptidase [Candidatus Roizmanbacteria bacterium]